MTESLQVARIIELPERVRNQIAAGEVVERPASVVKELVENAIDAGARRIRVDLEEGGARLVRVTDDGTGMSRADLELAFRPHATSKLRDVGDLEHIASLGFRGEALASIGSIARARILSRLSDAATGFQVEDEGGRVGEVVEAGAPRGTTVEIRDLFYNTPARRNFMKRTSTELGRCLDVLQRLIVGQDGIGFQVTHDKKKVLDVEPDMDRRARIQRLFGQDLAEALVEVAGRDGDTVLTGFVAPPRFARSHTTRQLWFLNGRPLRDRLLIRCLKQAFHGFAIDVRQPVAFLSLSMDPAKVDVNVHPTKTEVRFREGRRLFGFLVQTMRSAIATTDIATPGERMLQRVERRGELPASDWRPAPTLPDPGPARAVSAYRLPAVAPGAEPGQAWEARDEFAGPFLQVAKTYVVRALPDGFEILDQHALHERVTFERLKADLAKGGIEVQRLLVPELVELSRSEVQSLTAHMAALAKIGFELEPFGPTTVAIQGLPALLRHPRPETLLRDLNAMIERLGTVPTGQELLDEVLHSMACRSSVMAGDVLSDSEIQALLTRASELESDQTCPHGRPTRVRFRLSDLEKAFHRK